MLPDLHFDRLYAQAYAREWSRTLYCGGACPVLIEPQGVATHAYGYGGAIPDMAPLLAIGVTRLWWRFHPFAAEPDADAEREKGIVWIDLDGDPEAGLRKGHRSSVKLARSRGVKVASSTDIVAFQDMYLTSMRRLDAEPRWWISVSLLCEIACSFDAQILVASLDGEPEAACFLIGGFETCYYHYAASYRRHPAIGAGNLLVVEAAHWAKTRGYKRLHLGGGTTADPDDPLLRFKAGFSDNRAWTYVTRRTFN